MDEPILMKLYTTIVYDMYMKEDNSGAKYLKDGRSLKIKRLHIHLYFIATQYL